MHSFLSLEGTRAINLISVVFSECIIISATKKEPCSCSAFEEKGAALHFGASRYDVHIRRGREGVLGKANVLRQIALILWYKSDPNADKLEGG